MDNVSTLSLTKRHDRRRVWCLAVILLWAARPDVAFGFALAAPTGKFAEAGFADFGKGFSWPKDKEIEIAFDKSFTDAFGNPGKDVFASAFKTWATSSSNPKPDDNPLQLGQSRDDFRGKFDLETVSLHEIGHAIGLHHPTQAAGKDFTKGKNFDAKGNRKDPVELRTATPIMDLTPETTLGLEGVARRVLTSDDIEGFGHLYKADLKFKVGAKQAQIGTGKGADIDVFAFDFASMDFLKPFEKALAVTDTAIDKAPNAGPGNITGVDIFFNLKGGGKVPSAPSIVLIVIGFLLGVAAKNSWRLARRH